MTIFAGPTLNFLSRQLIEQKQIQLYPPVRRGDIEKLIRSSDPHAIAIVDGYFHQSLAVGHEEIMQALRRGWVITGLSSMGAIRAYELRDVGMSGYGKVYQRFVEKEDFQDDEVALHHLPAPDYKSLSEPLVHFRVCLDALVESRRIMDSDASEIIHFMKTRYFGDRTMVLFQDKFRSVVGMEFETMVTDFNTFRIKQKDLVDFIHNH